MAKILILDDSSFMRSSLKYIVEGAGYEVVGMARDGEEGIKKYKELKPDIVTLDIMMEPMDGIAVLKLIMREDPEAKVLMVTAIGTEEKKEEAKKLGSSGYLRKPFNPEEVVAEIEKIIKKVSS